MGIPGAWEEGYAGVLIPTLFTGPDPKSLTPIYSSGLRLQPEFLGDLEGNGLINL